MTPRDYQDELVKEIITEFFTHNHKTVLACQPTGTGKTVVIAAFINYLLKRDKTFNIWFTVPRRELLEQGSNHLKKWGINHGRIAPKFVERLAYNVHVVSKGSHERRKIKRAPDFIILDEAHMNHAYQLKLAEMYPDTKILGLTATAERTDGKGLSIQGGGIFETLIESHSIPWYYERGYLVRPKYHAFQIEDLDKIKRRGTELDSKELQAEFDRKKIYGKVVAHYQKYGLLKKTTISLPGAPVLKLNNQAAKGMPGVFFCSSVAIAEAQAVQFQGAGFAVFPVSGKTPDKLRNQLIEALRRGEIDGLTTCDLITYGVDIPRAEYGAFLRPTLSKALYFQMMGRVLRPYALYSCLCGNVWDNAPYCPVCGKLGNLQYKKEGAFLFDHVGNYKIHEDKRYPGMPLVYLDDVEWNFHGKKKKKQNDGAIVARPCPFKDGEICEKPSCIGCPDFISAEAPKDFSMTLENPEEIDIELKEIEAPKKLAARPLEERREYTERMSNVKQRFKNGESGTVVEMCKIADELQRHVMWVYNFLNENKHTVNVQLLWKIRAAKHFKKGWVFHQEKALKQEIESKAESLKDIRAQYGIF